MKKSLIFLIAIFLISISFISCKKEPINRNVSGFTLGDSYGKCIELLNKKGIKYDTTETKKSFEGERKAILIDSITFADHYFMAMLGFVENKLDHITLSRPTESTEIVNAYEKKYKRYKRPNKSQKNNKYVYDDSKTKISISEFKEGPLYLLMIDIKNSATLDSDI